MKLSEIKGERALDVLADIVEPAANIASDKDFKELMTPKKLPEGKDAGDFFFERAKTLAPRLIKRNKRDVIAILAAIEGVTAKEYTENMTVASLIQAIIDLLTDDDLLSFLFSPETEKE